MFMLHAHGSQQMDQVVHTTMSIDSMISKLSFPGTRLSRSLLHTIMERSIFLQYLGAQTGELYHGTDHLRSQEIPTCSTFHQLYR